MRFIVFLFFVACFLCPGILQAQGLKVGAAVRVITPDPLLPVSGGIGTPVPVTEKRGDLFARAMVIENQGTRVAIVSVDMLGWTSVLGDRSRALVRGIPPENILIGATHGHSSPDPYGFPDAQGKSYADVKYLEWCAQEIASAIQEALKNARPAALKIAVGEAKGQIAYNYYAPDLYDPRCGVIQAVGTSGRDKGKVIATLVNYAIHPEILGPKRGILSPDLCGPLYERIESRAGGVAVFMNGAQGGMVTADNRRADGGENNTWDECIRIGHLLADEALRIVGDAEEQNNAQLLCASRTVEFPIDSEIMRFILRHSPLNLNTAMRGDSIQTRLNYLQIGTARVLTIPGEALPNIGYYLKRKLDTPHAFLFGLTNDAFGYIMTKEDFGSFKRYEYITRTSLGEMTGEIFVDSILEWMSELEAVSPVSNGNGK